MAESEKPYRVLARKYRPQNFDELIGQDALVRTLQNAITSGRVAHAFMLTGVRGVGKTTTARIIAKALNYKGPDGTAEATTGDTSDCPLCQAISEDRHPDVIEMDAASRTGVDDIREILDGVRYAPTEARYKIYVIDEVHMLSKNAFNALLKTLEEPPEHVKFIFATTEIRKVPITVLSRCQRFDLNRVGVEELIPHFKNILEQEKVKAQDEALAMIARAADGSVRDGLSLLDQAIALSTDEITADNVQNMLGLSDRARNLDLIEKALSGDIAGALSIMSDIYKNGGVPSLIIEDLLDLTHMLTKIRAVPDLQDIHQNMAADQIERAKELASKLSMPSLSKTWQILLAGLDEVNSAPNPQNAAEIVIIRLSYAANLPDPADLVKKLKDFDPSKAPTMPQGTGSPAPASGGSVHAQDFSAPAAHIQNIPNGDGTEIMRVATPELTIVDSPAPLTVMHSLQDIVSLLEQHSEFLLSSQLYQFAHLVNLKHKLHDAKPSGKLEMRLEPEALPDLSQNVSKALRAITGHHWMVVISKERGAQTLFEQAEAKRLHELEEVSKMPEIKNILNMFEGSQLVEIIEKIEHNDQEDPNT